MDRNSAFVSAALMVFAGIVSLVKFVDQRASKWRRPRSFTRRQVVHLVATIVLLGGGILLGATSV